MEKACGFHWERLLASTWSSLLLTTLLEHWFTNHVTLSFWKRHNWEGCLDNSISTNGDWLGTWVENESHRLDCVNSNAPNNLPIMLPFSKIDCEDEYTPKFAAHCAYFSHFESHMHSNPGKRHVFLEGKSWRLQSCEMLWWPFPIKEYEEVRLQNLLTLSWWHEGVCG